MMLVISVIVAVAILGILLKFIVDVNPVADNAKTVVPELVKNTNSKGFGVEIKDKVKFDKGAAFYRENAIGSSSILPANLEFKCDDTLICGSIGSGKPLEFDETHILANQDVSTAVAVCTNGRDNKFKVVLSQNVVDARAVAETACGLNG